MAEWLVLETLVKKNVAPGFSHASAQILPPRASLRYLSTVFTATPGPLEFFLAVQSFEAR